MQAQAAVVEQRRDVGREVEATRRRLTPLEEALLLHAAAQGVTGAQLESQAADWVRTAVQGGVLPLPGCSCRGAAPVTLRYLDAVNEEISCDLRIDGAHPEQLVSAFDALLALRDAVLGLTLVPGDASFTLLRARLAELRTQATKLTTLTLETES